MLRYFLLLTLLTMPVGVYASAWKIDYQASTLTFTANQTGNDFEGKFSQFSVDVILNPEMPETGSIKASVETKSVSAGTKERNSSLPQREWFYSEKFPTAVFESTKIIKKTDESYIAKGKLTIKGISKDIEMPFTLKPEGEKTRAEGVFIVSRNNFQIGIGEWESEEWVKFPVVVKFSLLAEKS